MTIFLLNFSHFGVQEYVLISRSVLFMFIIQKLLYNFKTEIKKYKTLLLSVSHIKNNVSQYSVFDFDF